MSLIASNKKAYQNFFLTDKVECGLVLTGGEVKSIRAGHVNFKDSYAKIKGDAIYLCNLHINPYKEASYLSSDPERERKLLLHKKEIKRLMGLMTQKAKVLIPTRLYFNKRGFVKVELAFGEGKKLYDKRDDIKTREVNREISRAIRRRGP